MEEAIREADTRATEAENALAAQKGDLDQKMREKDDELENIKCTSTRHHVHDSCGTYLWSSRFQAVLLLDVQEDDSAHNRGSHHLDHRRGVAPEGRVDARTQVVRESYRRARGAAQLSVSAAPGASAHHSLLEAIFTAFELLAFRSHGREGQAGARDGA